MLKKLYAPFIFLAALCSMTLHSQAQIVVDGKLSDWDTTRFSYDDENKLWYDFRKDDQFLYVALLILNWPMSEDSSRYKSRFLIYGHMKA